MKRPTPFTPQKRARFLAGLSEGLPVKYAAQAAGLLRETCYARRRADPEFAAAWEEALGDGTETLEYEARRRAMESSDTLLIFLLKARRPEIYRDHARTGPNVNVSGDKVLVLDRDARNQQFALPPGMTWERLRELRDLLSEEAGEGGAG